MDKMVILYKRSEKSKIIMDVEWKGKNFVDVEIKGSKWCRNDMEYVRNRGIYFKSAKLMANIFNIVTGGILVGAILTCKYVLETIAGVTNPLTVLGWTVAIFLVSDIICTYTEYIAIKVTQMFFELKIKKSIKKSIKKQEKEDQIKQKEEKKRLEEALSKDESYKKIYDAEVWVAKFEELVNNFDLGKNSYKTTECITNLRDIINQLKDNSSSNNE